MKFLIIDTGGLHVSTARKLGYEGHETYYYNPWYSAYPQFQSAAPGYGLSKIIKVLDFGPYIDKVDCIVFPDVGLGEFADYLRNHGYNVVGAGLGEKMELNRKYSCEQMDKYGIKYPKSHFVKGISNCLSKLKEIGVPEIETKNETNQITSGKAYVKFDIWRGNLETFPAQSITEAKRMFDKMAASIGPYTDDIPITIQEKVDGVEFGLDLWFNGKEFLKPYMWGFESGGDYIGKISNKLSDNIENELDKAAAILRSHNYCGAISNEWIYDGNNFYWLDWTPRFPMPLGMLYTVYNDSIGNLFYGCSKKDYVSTGLPLNKYLGCAMVVSEDAKDTFIKLNGNSTTRFLRFMGSSKGEKYAVPGTSTLGIIPGCGSNFEELKEDLRKNSDGVSAYFGSFNIKFVDDVVDKYVKSLQEYGIDFTFDYMDSSESLAKRFLNTLLTKYF